MLRKIIDKKCLNRVILEKMINEQNSFDNNNFSFIGLSKQFEHIDWNFSEYCNLWTYNLNYFNFLIQKDISYNEGVVLIKDFIKRFESINLGNHPYPISLRNINWIKFIANNHEKFGYELTEINEVLYSQYIYLTKNIEYHLMGNHVLENLISIMWCAIYFNDKKRYKKFKIKLITELNKQILNDGGHFEQSPMYHQIILHRLLDFYNYLNNNNVFNDYGLIDKLKWHIESMLSFLRSITFSNGEIPMFNDSTVGIAPASDELFAYAKNLEIEEAKKELDESGLRIFKLSYLECVVCIGGIAANCQPGHRHSDIFSFVLNAFDRPLIVDTGISTYNKNKVRQLERSTSSHNTVQINDIDPIQVWGGFRVGRRAKVEIIRDEKYNLKALHDGYKRINAIHTREFSFNTNSIVILDKVTGKNSQFAYAYIHFHPRVKIKREGNVLFADSIKLIFNKAENIKIETYNYAHGFNDIFDAKKLIVRFKESLFTQIIINENINT